MNQTSDGRRPIASRESGWAKASAKWLAKRNVSPNFISVLSVVFSIVAFVAFYFDATATGNHTVFMILAIVGIEGRLIMNLFDGMLAVVGHVGRIAGHKGPVAALAWSTDQQWIASGAFDQSVRL